jgi:uncharacterized protein YegP (UPF0339 family)
MNMAKNGLFSLMIPSYSFEIKNSRDGQFYWIMHNNRGNTEPFAQSETYKTKQSCLKSIELVKEFAANARISDHTNGLL